MIFRIFTLIFNNERPLDFQNELPKIVDLLEGFGEKSRNHEINKCCEKYLH